MTMTQVRTVALCLPALVLVGLSGCRNSVSAAGGGSAADLSPAAPTFNQQFETRNPRVCVKMTHAPSAAEAAVMVQCQQEANSRVDGSSPGFFLATDVVVQMGSPKPYNPGVDNYLDDIDPAAMVYPLRGSSTGWSCTPVNEFNKGKNCSKSFGGDVGKGSCWHTQFGEWRCIMTIGGTQQQLLVKGPTAF